MSDFRARIRRVRMKDGADVTILDTERPHGDPENPSNWRGDMIRHAKMIGDGDEPGSRIQGYLVVGMFSDGRTSIGYKLDSTIPRTLMVAWLSEILRRDMITELEAERVFDEHFQWVEG